MNFDLTVLAYSIAAVPMLAAVVLIVITVLRINREAEKEEKEYEKKFFRGAKRK